MGKLASLLRWKRKVELKDEHNNPILDENGSPVIVWVRLLGDFDLQEAYKRSRVESSKMRELLRTPESPEYKDQVEPLFEADEEQCKEIIRAAKGANWTADAYSVVERPNLIEMSEIAIDPDAPTLEEQEKLDKQNEELDVKYKKDVEDYIDTKSKELEAELSVLNLEELREKAKFEVSNVMPLSTFVVSLNDEKVWRSVYVDEGCKERGFSNIGEFREASPIIREQLIKAYINLESGVSVEELKN
jgi:hypothetical protein